MPDFFLDRPCIGLVALSPEDSHHALRALRMRPGDALRVCHDGRRFEAELQVEGAQALARVIREIPTSEANTRITLYQGWPKGDKLDQIVRQATEIGVAAITPVFFRRCVARPDQPGKRVERLNKIAREAAMQSGRTLIPQVEAPIEVTELALRLKHHQQALIAYELEVSQTLWEANTGAKDTALIIGPEGGLTPEEVLSLDARPVSLGRRILRTETAGIVACAMLLAINRDD